MVDNCAIEKKFLPDVPWLISVGDVQYGMLSKGNPCNRYSAQSRAVFPRSYCTISAPVRTAPMRPCLSTWWQQNWEANLSRWETAEIEAWYGHCVIPCNLKRPKTLHACRRSLGEDVAKNTFHLRKIVGFLFTSFFLCWFVWVFVLCFCSLFVYDVAFYCFCPSLTEVNRTIRDFQNHSLHADVYAKSWLLYYEQHLLSLVFSIRLTRVHYHLRQILLTKIEHWINRQDSHQRKNARFRVNTTFMNQLV